MNILFISRYVYSTDAGVMSIDIHPEHPFLVVVGLYNGKYKFIVCLSVVIGLSQASNSQLKFSVVKLLY